MKELFRNTEIKMKQALDHFHDELRHLRTGRASLTLLEGITADYYGTQTPLNQLANLSVADAQTIVAQPWDASAAAAIEKAILQSDLGLNPSNDGKVIRIPIPTLTEERRREIVKRAHEYAESARNGVRQARREGNEELKRMEKAKEIGQDEEHRGLEEVQRLHDHYIAEITKSLEVKENDLMTV
jgi:ribosome recycling factor